MAVVFVRLVNEYERGEGWGEAVQKRPRCGATLSLTALAEGTDRVTGHRDAQMWRGCDTKTFGGNEETPRKTLTRCGVG